jgi:hypothetical protein
MLTKKDFKVMAAIIDSNRIENQGKTTYINIRAVSDLADYFATKNPEFDREKFLKACGI